MDKGYSPFVDEEEVVIRDSQWLWITAMKEETYEVYGDQHQVLVVYFNAYQENDFGGVNEFNKKEYGKAYWDHGKDSPGEDWTYEKEMMKKKKKKKKSKKCIIF